MDDPTGETHRLDMKRTTSLSVLLLSLVSLSVACGDDDGTSPDTNPDPSDSGVDTASDTSTRPDTGMGDTSVDTSSPDTGSPPSGWAVRSHPCPGVNRTDAFFVDSDGAYWLGCGSGADGDGLFYSEDQGQSWMIPATNPANVLTEFRVLSIHRGADGLLYVAGEGPARAMAISLDTSSSPFAAAAVLTRGSRIGFSFLASPFVTTASGAAFADSFNGSDLLYRPDGSIGDDAEMWTNAGDWEDDGSFHQILDAVLDETGERLIGCGSTIAEPPLVYLPSQAAGAEPWQMTPVTLVDGLGSYTGEMWGVAANADRVVVVGVDQDNNVGKVFVSGADRYNAGDYTETSVDPLVNTVGDTDSTWSRGVCMRGDRVVVVGEVQPLGAGDNAGFVLESDDGGATFTDITPEGSPVTWSKCSIAADGTLSVAGAGMIAVAG